MTVTELSRQLDPDQFAKARGVIITNIPNKVIAIPNYLLKESLAARNIPQMKLSAMGNITEKEAKISVTI